MSVGVRSRPESSRQSPYVLIDGAALRRERLRRSYGLRQLAGLTGLSRSRLSEIETSERPSNVNAEHFGDLCRSLGLTDEADQDTIRLWPQRRMTAA